MTGWDVAAVVWVVFTVVWLAVNWYRRRMRTFDAHIDQALALAATRRHPSTRDRDCLCQEPESLRAHSPMGCVPTCACRRLLPDPEPWHHGALMCAPLREMVNPS